jgi:tRNA threonylcarbamoyladenosine biosynthesis protein TsaB
VLVAALDTATLTLSCALVDLVPGAPPKVRCERTVRDLGHRGRAKGQPDELDPAPQGAPNDERGFAAGTHLERAGGPGGREGAARVSPRQDAVGGHSASLPKALVDLLEVEGLAIPDVEGFAIGLGPGSFTGLRIGLATWKGLAYANKRPIAGASSLAAMAHAAARDAEEGTLLVPLLDARKGELYAGFYRARAGGLVELAVDAALPPEALAARVAALAAEGLRPAAFGEGLAAYPAALAAVPRLRTEVATPPAAGVAAVVAERLATASYDAQALFALEPHYVRASEAELKFPDGIGPGARQR